MILGQLARRLALAEENNRAIADIRNHHTPLGLETFRVEDQCGCQGRTHVVIDPLRLLKNLAGGDLNGSLEPLGMAGAGRVIALVVVMHQPIDHPVTSDFAVIVAAHTISDNVEPTQAAPQRLGNLAALLNPQHIVLVIRTTPLITLATNVKRAGEGFDAHVVNPCQK